jgi:hypothetical protein
MTKICFRCKKEIDQKGKYYKIAIVDYENGKIKEKSEYYHHEECDKD